ncbi:LOB domain-containing protein 2-like [Vicia villosa]|uniref:LOB domain-containing protein 2-like n=1 Tax=Vicia villosa TaxID=3911 RepID=UPI00273C6F4F|nr:LOB domain-containing protein 2-like [Vicia villosa]
MVKSCEETERKRVVESLIWEAICRQKDPINGSLGPYKKIYNEYRRLLHEVMMLKGQAHLLHMQSNQGLMSTKPIISDSNGMDYHLQQNNGVMDAAAFYNAYYSQDFDSLRNEVGIPIQQHSSQDLKQVMNSISEQWEQMEEGTRVGNHTV